MSANGTLLVVNDDPVQLRLACALLERAGYDVRATERAADALRLLVSGTEVDGVVTDLHMPEIDGWRFCRLLRSPAYERLHDIPILVVSATFSGIDAERLTKDLGANGFLSAPYAPAALLDAVAAMLAGESAPTPLELLVVQADTPARAALCRAFEGHGYHVRTADDAVAAATHVARHVPAAVVLDHDLPSGGAEDFLQRLKAPGGPSAVVVLHESSDGELPLRLTLKGADSIALKPCDPEYVVELCERARRQHSLLRVEDLLEERTIRLRDSEQQLRAIFQTIPEFVLICDTEGVILDANHAAAEALDEGRPLVGRSLAEFLDEAEAARLLPRLSGLPAGASRCYETTYRGADGPIGVEVTERPFRLRNRDAVLSVARDVRARRQAEKERALLATALEQAVEVIVLTDADGRIQYVNPAFERVTGHPRDEATGHPIAILRHEDEAWRALQKALARGEVWRGRMRRRRKDGTTYVSEGTITPVRDERGAIRHFVGVERDVTAQLELEHALQQAKKMEAIGTLAGGIAHDFNNLLTGILGYANLLRRLAPDGSEIEEMAQVIESSADRASELTRQLLGFARRGKHRHVPVDLHETVAQVERLLSRTIDKSIRIRTRLVAQPASVLGDPTQMEQALLNLALNARDAMAARPEGELVFATDVVIFDAEYCAHHPGAKPGHYVLVSVTDNGCGIPEENRTRIFEPFFTTKPRGEGTGMGLSMTYGIVKSHGGTIRVYSEVDRGTTFRVYLPLDGSPAAAAAPVVEREPVRGAGTILLVDDEDIVRQTAAAMLRQLGYTVTALADGEEAVLYYEAFADTIDLVVLDMVMPGLDGAGCYERIRALEPDARVVLSTGFGLNEAAQAILDRGVAGFIQKPFRVDELSRIVAGVLAGETCHAER